MVGDERREEGRPLETKTVPIGEQSGIPGSLPVHGQNTGSQCSDCLRHETVVRQSRMMVDAIEEYLAGRRPSHICNPEVLG